LGRKKEYNFAMISMNPSRAGHWEGMSRACPYLYFTQKYYYPTYTQPIVFDINMNIIDMGIIHIGLIHMGYTHGYPWVYYFLPNTHNYK